jgi:multisubunit Na+/H+ antiporter MnhE subunit
MTGILLRAAGLTVIYLLVVTSLDPGDILVGAVLGLAIAIGLRPREPRREPPAPRLVRLRAAADMVRFTGWEMILGTWRVVRFCLGAPSAPGFVEIPRADRSHRGSALWGVITGEAPDEVPVHIDERRGVLIVHLVDASDPEAVRARHEAARDRWQRHLVP